MREQSKRKQGCQTAAECGRNRGATKGQSQDEQAILEYDAAVKSAGAPGEFQITGEGKRE